MPNADNQLGLGEVCGDALHIFLGFDKLGAFRPTIQLLCAIVVAVILVRPVLVRVVYSLVNGSTNVRDRHGRVVAEVGFQRCCTTFGKPRDQKVEDRAIGVGLRPKLSILAILEP